MVKVVDENVKVRLKNIMENTAVVSAENQRKQGGKEGDSREDGI